MPALKIFILSFQICSFSKIALWSVFRVNIPFNIGVVRCYRCESGKKQLLFSTVVGLTKISMRLNFSHIFRFITTFPETNHEFLIFSFWKLWTNKSQMQKIAPKIAAQFTLCNTQQKLKDWLQQKQYERHGNVEALLTSNMLAHKRHVYWIGRR